MIHESCRTHLDMPYEFPWPPRDKKKKFAHLVLDLVIVASNLEVGRHSCL